MAISATAQMAMDGGIRIERDGSGGLFLDLQTSKGGSYRIEKSEDLISWNLIDEFVAVRASSQIILENEAELTHGFYRVSESVNPLQSALNENRAKWTSIGWADYQLRIDVSEFVPEEVSQGIVTVEAGQVVDVELPLATGDFPRFQFNYPLSVEGLFDRLQWALDQDPVSVRIGYHPDFGFPTEAFIDFDERIADEESGFRVALLGASRIENRLSFELPSDPYTIHEARIRGDSLELDLEYGGGCAAHFFSVLDLMPGMFAESEPPRPILGLRHDNNDDRCKALVRDTRSFDLSPLVVSAVKVYGRPIPLVIELLSSVGSQTEPISLLYTPGGSDEFVLRRATSQAWVGGVQGSGSGIDYRFSLVLLNDELPVFTDIWIGQRRFEPRVQLPQGIEADSLGVGDAFDIVCSFRRVPVFAGAPFESEIVDWRDEPEIGEGPDYDGAALVRYELAEGPSEIEVPSIERLPDLLFP